MLFYDQLKNIELEGKIIRVGLVGAGFMGKGKRLWNILLG